MPSPKHDIPAEPPSAPPSFVDRLFSIPRPVKNLFDRVPLLTYPPNPLPQRSPRASRLPSLYIFSTEQDATAGRPSFNPSCLKWQTFLKIAGVDHRLISSNNHASPTGSLPFLLPAAQSSQTQESPSPIPSSKIRKYAVDHGATIQDDPSSIRYEAYQSLLDHRVRCAWLYTLYLTSNFSTIATPLYILPVTSNPLARASLAHSLRAAAAAELLKHARVIDAEDIYREAERAFDALEALLGDDEEWFFGAQNPGLFDASVFAYTHLLLDERLVWQQDRLVQALRRRRRLCRHRESVLGRAFPGVSE